MNGVLLDIEGAWGHFKKPETNNNPLTHDLITKTALIGMIGAVLGISRPEMRELFPQMSDDLLYGVAVNNPIRKQSWGFTMRRLGNPSPAPVAMEILRDPKYTVALALSHERSASIFGRFVESVAMGDSLYEPVLGLHNCPAEVRLVAKGEFAPGDGAFETYGFVQRRNIARSAVTSNFRVGFERLPTYQDNDFWNRPERYVDVIYPDGGNSLAGMGSHFTFDTKTRYRQWDLI